MKALVILSGGMDSSVLAAYLKGPVKGYDVRALTIDYGQRHVREIESAKAIADWLKIRHEIVDLSALAPHLGGSSQTDERVPVPEGHYSAESMKATVVPNRNMLLLAVGAARAISTGCGVLAYAAHAGDHAIYPDCRPEFASAMETALLLCDWKPVQLMRPFINFTKAEIVRVGLTLGVPFGKTYSCYKGHAAHCGRCGTCVERREAFQLAGMKDPTDYASDAPALEEILAKAKA
jgi:7-cyano-7-deazaguanine synthase